MSDRSLRPGRSARHLRALYAGIGEGRRILPSGPTGLLVRVLSIIFIGIVGWYALFGRASAHYQIAWLITLLLPVSFLTTTAGRTMSRITPIDALLALASLLVG